MHDVFDRRIGKVAAGSATYYVYDGTASWADFNPAGDANLYRYVGNSPTNATDPTGRAAAVQYAMMLVKFVGSRISFEVNAPTMYEVMGSMVGSFSGFSAATFFFVANIMEVLNSGGDIFAQWGAAASRAKAQTDELQRTVGLLSLITDEAVPGFVGGFLTGAGIEAGFKIDLTPVGDAIADDLGYSIPPVVQKKIGGFVSGVETALDLFAQLQPR